MTAPLSWTATVSMTAIAEVDDPTPGLLQEQAFGLRHLTWGYRTSFLKKIEGKGYYALESPAGL